MKRIPVPMVTRTVFALIGSLLLLSIAPTAAQSRVPVAAPHVPYGADNEPDRRLDVYLPAGFEPPFPVLMVFHGYGGDKSDANDLLIPDIAARVGIATVAVNYTEQLPEAYADAWCALSWVQTAGAGRGLDPSRVITLGISFGAHPAAMLGVQDDPSLAPLDCPHPDPDPEAVLGVVTLGGRLHGTVDALQAYTPEVPVWSDPALAEQITALPPEAWPQSDLPLDTRMFLGLFPMAWVSEYDAPHLIIHGAGDSIVPYTEAYDYARILARNRTNGTVLLDRLAGHVPGPNVFDRELETFLTDVLAGQNWVPSRTRPSQYNLLYGTEQERSRRLDIYVPEGVEAPYPVVLAFHGSGTADKADIEEFGIPELAARAGAATVTVNYRTDEPLHAYQDAFCALAWLQAEGATYDLDPSRVVALGHSYGGLPATMLGALDDPSLFPADCPHGAPDLSALDGVITVAGLLFGSAESLDPNYPLAIPDPALIEVLGDTPPEQWLTLDLTDQQRKLLALLPMTHIDPSEPPHLLVQGAEDETIPYSQAFDYAEILSRNRTSAVLVVDKYSGHVPPPFAYDSQMQSFLERAFAE